MLTGHSEWRMLFAAVAAVHGYQDRGANTLVLSHLQGTAAQFDAFKSNVAFIHTYNAAHPSHQVGGFRHLTVKQPATPAVACAERFLQPVMQ